MNRLGEFVESVFCLQVVKGRTQSLCNAVTGFRSLAVCVRTTVQTFSDFRINLSRRLFQSSGAPTAPLILSVDCGIASRVLLQDERLSVDMNGHRSSQMYVSIY